MIDELLAGLRSWALVALALAVTGCGSGDDNDDHAGPTRPFLMGATPFFTQYDATTGKVTFPDWRFENLDERDLLSLHVDDFWGVPWDYCDAAACTNLPPSWTEKWQALNDQAKATGKRLYLSVSPLGDRRTLAPTVLPDGGTQAGWNVNVDANGCYLFASDPQAATYQASYIT